MLYFSGKEPIIVFSTLSKVVKLDTDHLLFSRVAWLRFYTDRTSNHSMTKRKKESAGKQMYTEQFVI